MNSNNISNTILNQTSCENSIIEVFEENFISEIKKIGRLLKDYPYIGMDTEFPGTVFYQKSFSEDFYYKTMKTNVDNLKLIQLGITLMNEKGEKPEGISTWQFNLKFNFKGDYFSPESFSMLCNAGIDFEKIKNKGITYSTFAEYLMVSGLVLNSEVHWISYHGSYDFAYLLRLLLNDNLPETETSFTETLKTYFPSHFDIRILIKGKSKLQGGLNRLVDKLGIVRQGIKHQAGSDSLVTVQAFFALIECREVTQETVNFSENILYGLGEGANDEETISYMKFNTENNCMNYQLNIHNIYMNNNSLQKKFNIGDYSNQRKKLVSFSN